MELIFELSPLPTFDFYEPREFGRYVFIPERIITVVNFPPMTITFTMVVQPTFTAFNEKAETHTVLFRSKIPFQR
jgi:hypothetical protein